MAALLVIATTGALSAPASAAPPPSGFSATSVTGLTNPTAMAIAADGRIFVSEQGGKLRVVKNGALLAAAFVQLSVNSSGERGLLGVTFDPNFVANGFVYVYYTVPSPTVHNRVSRFTANGDTATPGSESVLLDLPAVDNTNHNGGGIHFGPDGKLYIAVGENGHSERAQELTNPFGKLLRINSDGSIPADNPFNDGGGANYDAIWAFGLRNPFTFGFQPGTGRLFANDVGQDTWEEVDDVFKGANFGWPGREGPCVQGSTTNCGPPPFGIANPVFAYTHSEGCAITGGAFYNPQPSATEPFPANYNGAYFLGDLCGGWLRTLAPAGYGSVTAFTAPDSSVSPVDIGVASDGSVWYVARGQNSLVHVRFQAAQWRPPQRVRPDGVLRSGPAAAAVRGFGRVDSFVLGTDNAVYWTSYQGTGFSSWTALGAPPGGAVGEPAAVSWAPGRLDLFVRGADSKLWQRFSTNGGTSWSLWQQPVPDGLLAASPAVAAWAADRLDVFVTGTDGQVYQRFWDGTVWSSAWLPRGNPSTGSAQGAPAAASWAPGRVDVFVRGADSRLWQTFWDGTKWSAWVQPPGTASGVLSGPPSAASWGFNHYAVFTRGTDAGLYTTAWNGTSWVPWQRIGGSSDVIVGPPGATSRGFAQLDVFARGTDDRLYLFFFGR
ncbi:MAG: hypothetical protein QOI95_493 [Acidimicrobiaceae bacterium]